MNWKRTNVSYVTWLLLGVLTCAIGNETTRIITAAWGLNKRNAGIAFAGVLLLGGLFSVLIFNAKKRWMPEKFGTEKTGIKKFGTEKFWGWMEAAFVMCLVALGARLRLNVFLPLLPGGMYSHAVMQYATPLPEYFYGVGDGYLHLLHGICFLLGNTPEHCIRFQFLITMIAGIVLWLGVRSVSGKVPALCMAAFYYLTPYLTQRTGVLSPEPLFFLIYGIGLLLMGAWLRNGGESVILAVFAGLWTGIAGYGDLIGFTLLVFGFSAWHYNGQADDALELAEGEKVQAEKRKWYAGLGILLVCAIVGWLACLFLKSLAADDGLGNALGLWWDQACPSARIYLSWEAFLKDWFPTFPGSEASILLTVLLVLGCFGFFFDKSREGISVWTVTALISLGSMIFENVHVVRLFTYGSLGEPKENLMPIPFDPASGCLFLLCLCVLGGIALRSFFGPCAVAENVYESAGGGNLVSKYLHKQAEKKAQRQEEVDKVMRALTSLSEDHIVWTDGIKPTQHSAYHSPRPERSSQNVLDVSKEDKKENAEPPKVPADIQIKSQDPVTVAEPEPAQLAVEEKQADVKSEQAPEEGAKKAQGESEDALGKLKKPVEKLQNPLPLPKKHVTTVMEYDYEVPDDDDYDYD